VEHSDPATLVTSLNEYFEGMIAIVFQHEGTVSKIVGDAIAVMFSAPLVQEDHASRAIACALDLDIYAQKFAAEKQKQGMDLGRTRIGVNTGSVILCSIGGKNQLDYRALGDAINTAARLESANKYLGTRVCISETTVSQCSNFLGRPIGSLLLKGKTKPVTTFEPLTQTDMELESTGEYLKVYKEMEQKSDHALEALKNLVKKYPNDKLAARHLQRYISGETGSDVVLPWK
jgi:adenylate cyclase